MQVPVVYEWVQNKLDFANLQMSLENKPNLIMFFFCVCVWTENIYQRQSLLTHILSCNEEQGPKLVNHLITIDVHVWLKQFSLPSLIQEYEAVTKGLNRNNPSVPPSGTMEEAKQIELWKKYINWEKENPLRTEDQTLITKRGRRNL